MEVLIGSFEDAVAKNGKPFVKAFVKKKDKTAATLFVWNNIDGFKEALGKSKILEVTANFDDQFPEVLAFKVVDGNPLDFVECVYPSDDYAKQLFEKLVSFITDETLKTLVQTVFTEEVKQKFIIWPAARGYHHNYRYGLLEHTFEVMSGVSAFCNVDAYALKMDKQIALTGALLHDVAKIYDYEFDGYSSIENGIGLAESSHLSTGAEMVAVAFAKMQTQKEYSELEARKVDAVKHIIRSHHALIEWNAVAKPATLEAYAVFCSDYFSAAYNKFAHIDFNESILGVTDKRETFINYLFEANTPQK